ncbi:hypothetical protein ASZ90_010608 [hydrocarbon metagenome]|uniref:Uncharacterized protein n=1 Tax=hydrocarbon metagenome TaxID=938273 RepID=A0A0W8FFN2_9ZZZZ
MSDVVTTAKRTGGSAAPGRLADQMTAITRTAATAVQMEIRFLGCISSLRRIAHG